MVSWAFRCSDALIFWPYSASVALSVLHAAGCVHRDVSHANILLVQDSKGGHPRGVLADLEFLVQPGDVHETRFCGTMWFVAEEVYRQRFMFLPSEVDPGPPFQHIAMHGALSTPVLQTLGFN